MSIFKKLSVFGLLLIMSFFILGPAKVEAATVGSSLYNPEAGWQRVDNTNEKIKYVGTWILSPNSASTNYYNGSATYSVTNGDKIIIKFYGTKIRVISENYLAHSTNVSITLDGGQEETINIGTAINRINRYLSYEKLSLSAGYHTLVITNKTSTSTGAFPLDAIDIDDNGYLVDYNQITDLTAVANKDQIDLCWNTVEGATGYNVKRSTTSGGPYETIGTVIGSSISYTDNDVKPGITYHYVVSAVVNGTEGLNSNEATATILKSSNVLKLVLEKNEVKQLSVSEDLEDNTELTWTSSDTTIATVDANGKVKALKPGNTVITCTSEDGEYTDTINVLVVDLDYQLAVDLLIGEKCRLTVDDAKDTAKVTWTVNDPTIATVTSKGKVTAVSEGLTFITATDEDGKEIGKIFIRVRITE